MAKALEELNSMNSDAQFLSEYFAISLDWVSHWHNLMFLNSTQYFPSMEMLLKHVHARAPKYSPVSI